MSSIKRCKSVDNKVSLLRIVGKAAGSHAKPGWQENMMWTSWRLCTVDRLCGPWRSRDGAWASPAHRFEHSKAESPGGLLEGSQQALAFRMQAMARQFIVWMPPTVIIPASIIGVSIMKSCV